MRTGFASLAVVGVAACIAVYALTQQPKSTFLSSNIMTSEDLEFLKYVSKFSKSYGTKEEFEFRAEQFKNSLVKIAEENSKNDNTFSLGLNKFADWTPSEYRRILSYKPIKGARKTVQQSFENVSIPDAIDWRTKGVVNPVKD